MTIQDCRRRIKTAIDKLNKMDHKLCFGMEESEDSLYLTAVSRMNNKHRYGAYEIMFFFDDFKKKTTAYKYFMTEVERIVASTRLNDPKAYHNFSE